MKTPVIIFWFRRDLRLNDNAGLYHALRQRVPVLPVFIFDRNILDDLEDKADRRISFIYQSLAQLQEQLKLQGSVLKVLHDTPAGAFNTLIAQYDIQAVYTNHDYEPYARHRDDEVARLLQRRGLAFHSFKDQVIFEKAEILKDNGAPYTVFTPYSNRWKAQLTDFFLTSYPCEKYFGCFLQHAPLAVPLPEEIGFSRVGVDVPAVIDEQIIGNYDRTRDFPALDGTTRLSVHLRFGTVSIRQLAAVANRLNAAFLNELIWRDFYQMILWHFPHITSRSFKKEYDNIQWRNDEDEFERWCNGQTGYPLVDAGMRQLNATGYMHNRLRMVTASFLTKHLLVDWRWGDAYFAQKLLDYDLAANNGGWQWAAGSGCDAVPYFRIFNPYLQAKKFDPQGAFIRKWVPELDSLSYPPPVVAHETARQRCLQVYKQALQQRQ